jgi:hypothetical protein
MYWDIIIYFYFFFNWIVAYFSNINKRYFVHDIIFQKIIAIPFLCVFVII